ncbi:MAG: ABC transporter ATP-binding protein [Lachnospiraceae bacterium]|nr:ABC transporter ATP-binding protein [Lachnospiraceae bacterium]
MDYFTCPEKKPVLSLENVSYSYHTLSGETKALDHLSFQIYPGEFVAIVGPSGCGKSTLLNLLAGLLKNQSGELLFHHEDLYKTVHQAKIPRIGYMLQHDHLFGWRTIWENVTLGLELNDMMTPANLANVSALLEKYGLDEFRNKKPSQLSGGMRQRAALIRTLSLNPEVLLLDEPFSALDYQTRLLVSSDIGKIIRENKITALLVTHNLSEAISLADRILVLTRRPASLKSQMEISLTITDASPLGYRSAPEFSEYFNELWEDLWDEKGIG